MIQESQLTYSRCITAAALVAVLAGLSYARPAVAPASTKRAATQAGSRNRTTGIAAQSDAELEKAIRARFARSKIAADKFEVHVQGGKAVIEGTTNVLQHKGTATRLARSMGAEEVENHIQPSEEARQKAADNLTKGRRRAQIKRGETSTRSDQR